MISSARAASRGLSLLHLMALLALISILAAIAVPNYLAAQTRSKIGRVTSEMRRIGQALDAYRNDFHDLPHAGDFNHGLWIPGDDPDRFFPNARGGLALLTTPITYLRAPQFEDPFAALTSAAGPTPRPHFGYWPRDQRNSWLGTQFEDEDGPGLWWVLDSAGPDRAVERLMPAFAHRDDTGQQRDVAGVIYDPTNGSVSPGALLRVGGEISGTGAAGAQLALSMQE